MSKIVPPLKERRVNVYLYGEKIACTECRHFIQNRHGDLCTNPIFGEARSCYPAAWVRNGYAEIRFMGEQDRDNRGRFLPQSLVQPCGPTAEYFEHEPFRLPAMRLVAAALRAPAERLVAIIKSRVVIN